MGAVNPECNPLEVDHRPWGHYEVLLDSEHYKVKRITVNPGHRLSSQKHTKRQEYWTVVEGEGTVMLNDELHTLDPGDTIAIPKEAWHRIGNQSDSNLVFIEVQRGEYFGEDDIVRSQDDYGRP